MADGWRLIQEKRQKTKEKILDKYNKINTLT